MGIVVRHVYHAIIVVRCGCAPPLKFENDVQSVDDTLVRHVSNDDLTRSGVGAELTGM